jgi:hypothetical protein
MSRAHYRPARLARTSEEPSTDAIQSMLDMLILKTLSLEPIHGFGIARRVAAIARLLRTEA